MSHEIHTLYSFRRCPYAMRARMALVRAGVVFDIIEVDFKNKPQAMLDYSPKGTVPVLILTDGTVIDESIDIVKWACADEWRHADHELIKDNDGAFKHALDRYKYPVRYPDEDCSGARAQGESFLRKLDQNVQVGTLTLDDICIFPFVRQFANVDRTWFDALPYKSVQSWLTNCIESDLFKTVMLKV